MNFATRCLIELTNLLVIIILNNKQEEVMKKSESLALELNTLIESDEVAGAIRPIQERMR